MSHDRDALITAYRAHYGASAVEAEQAMRGVESAHAEKQNAQLLKALDDADGQHLSETQELRHSNAVLQRMLEVMPDKHMRFGAMNKDGTVEEPDKCADWCYACKLDRLQADVDEWKRHEAAARGACVWLAQIHGHYGPDGSILAHLQAGQYDEALTLIQTREQRRLSRTSPAIIMVVAVEDNYGKLDCCDEETAHVWVTVPTWSGRRAYLTGASPFMKAAPSVPDVYSLKDEHFIAELPLEPPPAIPEAAEYLEWPGLELAPPMDQVKKELGLT